LAKEHLALPATLDQLSAKILLVSDWRPDVLDVRVESKCSPADHSSPRH